MSHKVKKITGRRVPPPAARPTKGTRPTLRVSAEVHDVEFILTFDAAPWFQQASDDEIRALASIEWGGNMESDEVAQFARSYDKDVESLFEYIRLRMRGGKEGGYDCHVDEASALAWCGVPRPRLFPADAP